MTTAAFEWLVVGLLLLLVAAHSSERTRGDRAMRMVTVLLAGAALFVGLSHLSLF